MKYLKFFAILAFRPFSDEKEQHSRRGAGGRCVNIMPMSDTLEVRIAHLEGAYEQVDKRLGGVESALIQLRTDVHSSFTHLRTEMGQLRSELVARIDTRIDSLDSRLTGRMDSQFHWLIGITFTSWITLLLAIFFRR